MNASFLHLVASAGVTFQGQDGVPVRCHMPPPLPALYSAPQQAAGKYVVSEGTNE